jgi:hypothetical protein
MALLLFLTGYFPSQYRVMNRIVEVCSPAEKDPSCPDAWSKLPTRRQRPKPSLDFYTPSTSHLCRYYHSTPRADLHCHNDAVHTCDSRSTEHHLLYMRHLPSPAHTFPVSSRPSRLKKHHLLRSYAIICLVEELSLSKECRAPSSHQPISSRPQFDDAPHIFDQC